MTKVLAHALLAVVFISAVPNLAWGQTLTNPGSLPRVAPVAASRTTYGTSLTSYLTIFDTQFSPPDSGTTYSDLGLSSGTISRYATGGIGLFWAPVNLPHGALLTSLEIDACDSNGGGNHVVGILWGADILGTNSVSIASTLQSVSNPTTPCAQYIEDLSSLNYTVNNLTGRLFIHVQANSLDSTNSISGALIGYKLQVSPPPGSADFSDVPTSHPFFQFIEALYQSGITAGCGGGNYCPDTPVTRGEMAVFLSKALGLQFQ